MKNFITSMLGALVALIVFAFCAILLFIGVLGAIVSMGVHNANVPETKLEHGSYLVFDLSTNITDAPPVLDFSDFTGEGGHTLQLRTVTRAIREAGQDNDIAGILIKGSLEPSDFGSGYGALQEIRSALLTFRKSGKPVKAFLDIADTKDYYIASAASQITLDPYGMIYMPGLATEPMFLAGAFEKYGVGVQVTRVGKYKSYVETFTRKDMSPENREETQRLLNDLWGSLVAGIAGSRSIKPGAVQDVVDREGLIRAEPALAAKLVDRLGYRDKIIDDLKAETGRTGSKESFKQISLAAYARLKPDALNAASSNKIAIIYAEGDIVDGEGQAGEIGGDRYAREIRKLRQDNNVKAIVLRVNSPGGSATAAETIQREIRLAKEKIPVIVSMGTYAASGGYWISTYGNRIFAEPATITGSIGVFGIQFDVEKLASDWGVTFDRVKTGKFADALTITRPKTDEEIAVLQRMVDWIYGEFVRKVAEGRKLKKADVEEIAQGRVWSGSEALKLHLVDEMGGLTRAIAYAAQTAKVDNFRLEEFPEKKDLAQQIAELIGKVRPDSASARSRGVLAQIETRIESQLKELRTFNDPEGVYLRLPMDLSIH